MQKRAHANLFNFRPMVGLGRTVNRFLMEGESGNGGGPNGGAGGGNGYTREYVSDLRNEAKDWRLKHTDSQTALTQAQSDLKAAQDRIAGFEKSSAEASTAAQTAADARVIRAELKAHAKQHGAVDVNDVLNSMDLSKVRLDENGEVIGADELFSAFKTAKPHFFKAVNTSSTETPPNPREKNTPKHVRDMSPEDAAAAEAAYLRDSRRR